MSNFLNKFSQETYAETLDEKEKASKSKPVKPEKPEKAEKKDKEKKKKEAKAAETEALPPETPKLQEEHVRHRPYDIEETTKDPNYKRSQRIKIFAWIGGIITVIVLGTLLYFFMNQVRVPDYVNQPIGDLQTWANRNKITLDVQTEFSLEVNEGYIISIDPVGNSKVQKGSIVSVVVSDGADPEEIIPIPDFTGMASYQIQDWITTNRANNLRMNWENSDNVPSDQFVRIKFNDNATTVENYQRKDYGIVYISLGPVVYEKNIEVPDWVTTHVSYDLAQTWANTNGITLVMNKVNSTVAVGLITAQSVPAKTLVAKKDTITISVSQGMPVVIPDFSKISVEDAKQMVASNILNNADVTIVEMYSNTNSYGQYIWQDVTAGTKVNQSSTSKLPVRVYYALGRPFIDNLVGTSEKAIPQYFYNLNQSSANLTYSIEYVKTCTTETEKGNICWMSAYSQYVDVGSNITLKVYQPE